MLQILHVLHGLLVGRRSAVFGPPSGTTGAELRAIGV
jgi:hypothetical protein